MTNAVPRVLQRIVRSILPPGLANRPQISLNMCALDREKWPDAKLSARITTLGLPARDAGHSQFRMDAAEALRPCASHQLHQAGLRLVVEGVRRRHFVCFTSRQNITEHLVPQSSRRCFR